MRDERLPFRPVVEVNLARSGRVHSPELGFCTLSVDLINFRSSWPVPLTHRVGPEGRSLSLLYKTRGAKGLKNNCTACLSIHQRDLIYPDTQKERKCRSTMPTPLLHSSLDVLRFSALISPRRPESCRSKRIESMSHTLVQLAGARSQCEASTTPHRRRLRPLRFEHITV